MATANWYGQAGVGQWGATASRRVDWVTDSIKVALVTSAYTPDQDNHDFWDDAQANEVANGNGYTTGGQALTGKSVAYVAGSNLVALRAATTTWASLTKTFRRAIVYKDTGTPSTSPLLGWVDFGADQAPSAVDFSIVWDATEGVLKATVA